MQKNIKSNIIGACIVTIIFASIYTFKLTSSFIFHPDFARDMDDILKIVHGDITLIGPKLTFGGIYSGPYYYYLFFPILFLTKSITALVHFNAVLFALGLGYFWYMLRNHLGIGKAIIGTLFLGLTPLFLIASRNPSNAYTYLPFLLIVTTYIYFENPQKKKELAILGFFVGLIATFHLVILTVLMFLSLLILFFLKKKNYFLFYLGGFVVAFAPLILFEVVHHFVMFRNTFIDKSYMSFVENKNIIGGLAGKKNILENIPFIGQYMIEFTLIHPLIYLLVLSALVYLKKISKKEHAFLYVAAASYLFLAATLRFQFINHYLFPVSFLILFTFTVLLLQTRWYYLGLGFIVFALIHWPRSIYKPTWRTQQTYEYAVHSVISRNIVSKKKPFNIIQITVPDMRHPWGYEYRYFFRKEGYLIDNEQLYRDSSTLLIFSEDPKFDVKKLNSWEAQEFGTEYFKKPQKYKADTITIYKVSK